MNILSISDLLQEFIKAETEILNKQEIKHPVAIGKMYEGLTAEILNRTVFTGLDLKIVRNSFIEGADTEFDVMLVVGDGEQLPYTDSYKYSPEKIIAVIQVKKNLYSKDIADGYENLKYIVRHYEEKHFSEFMIRLFRDSFRAICWKDVTARKAGILSEYEDGIYDTLRLEAVLPVRIVWGYNGFANEFSFRESFQNYLAQNITTDTNNVIGGFGPHNFPNLIICGEYSMSKCNGMPFGGKVLENNWWPIYVTSSYNPTYYFLELIWTRLSYMFKSIPPDVFGEDLSIRPLNRFIDCRIKVLNGQKGWEYHYYKMSGKTLKESIDLEDWQPTEIDKATFSVINALGKTGEINIVDDKNLEKWVLSEGSNSLQEFLDKFTNSGLAYLENNVLRLLTDNCACVFTPDDNKCWAAENKSGRLTNWVTKKYDRGTLMDFSNKL